MTRKSNDKNYSLEQLKIWIEDAIYSEATPDEIYACIVEAITDTLDKQRIYQRDSKDLLDILMGRDDEYYHPKYSSFQEELEAEGYEYTPLTSDGDDDKKKKKDRSHLKIVK